MSLDLAVNRFYFIRAKLFLFFSFFFFLFYISFLSFCHCLISLIMTVIIENNSFSFSSFLWGCRQGDFPLVLELVKADQRIVFNISILFINFSCIVIITENNMFYLIHTIVTKNCLSVLYSFELSYIVFK